MQHHEPRPHAVRTLLVHRSRRSPSPWWHSCALATIPTPLSADNVAQISTDALALHNAGFDTVLVTLDDPVLLVHPSSPLPEFIHQLKARRQRVIVRIPNETFVSLGARGADMENRVTTLLLRTRGALNAGADGVDLGVCAEEYEDSPVRRALARERFTSLVRQVEAECATFDSQPIVTAHLSGFDTPAIMSHLEDDWFHHLHDDALLTASFDAPSLELVISDSLSIRDRIGAVAPWNVDCLPAERQSDVDRALTLLALGLPGVFHGRLCGESVVEQVSAASYIRTALTLRSERKLGTHALGVLHGLEWARPDTLVYLNSDVMIIVNTADQPLALPPGSQILVASSQGSDGVVAPRSCAWVSVARIQPAPTAEFSD